jgi:glycine oxidase
MNAMQNEAKVDVIVVGGGLAGIWTCFRLIALNKKVALIDLPEGNCSSSIAAGIYNPLLAKHQKLSYKAHEIYPHIAEEYARIEAFINEQVHHAMPIAYIIDQLKTLNDWAGLCSDDRFKPFVSLNNERLSDNIISDLGYLTIQSSAWVDIPHLMKAFKTAIQSEHIYLSQTFDYSLLQIHEDHLRYQDLLADKIVFCEGIGIQQNPFAAHIRLKPAKGEVLLINSQCAVNDCIPQQGVFLLPIAANTFKVGSNFEWQQLDTQITESAKQEIVDKLCEWFKEPFEIIDHKAGIRPSSHDRRPILGAIDDQQQLFVFNGLGSKGVALSPYYSQCLVDYMYNGTQIDDEASVNRYKPKC